MSEPVDNEDELREKAKVVAEATGRSEEEVLEDLRDDGIVNLSNSKDQPKDLVQQLTEAAELMNVVKKINKDISGNGVLNGKNNKTEVKVDTTLDGDIVDRAIESAQRKAENIKKLIITFAPVVLLLTGGGMEALGVINMFESEDEADDDYDNYEYDVYWGCTDYNAQNYDEYATDDDGSCYYDTGPGPPGPPPRQLDVQNAHLSTVGDDELKVEFNLFVEGDFCCDDIEIVWEIEVDGFYDDGLKRITYHSYDEPGFIDLENYWNDMPSGNYHARVEVKWMNDMWDEERTNGITIEDPIVWGCTDSEATNYDSNANEDDGTCEYPQPEECDAELYNQNAELTSDEEGITMSVDVYVGPEWNCDDWTFHLWFRVVDEEGQVFEQMLEESGVVAEPDRGDYRTWAFTDLEPGDYDPSIRLVLPESPWHPNYGLVDEQILDSITVPENVEPCDAAVHNHYRGHENNDPNSTTMIVAFLIEPDAQCGEIEWTIELFTSGNPPAFTRTGLTSGGEESVSQTFEDMPAGTWIPKITLEHEGEQVEQVQFWSLDIVEQEPEPCEINLWWIAIGTNATHASVGYDLDCGYEDNDLPGYNVTVQFLVYEVNGTNSGPNATGPINWTSTTHYIQGWVEDNRYLTLSDFTDSNATHYDFYFYAIWTDADGEQQTIEQTWLNREINP